MAEESCISIATDNGMDIQIFYPPGRHHIQLTIINNPIKPAIKALPSIMTKPANTLKIGCSCED